MVENEGTIQLKDFKELEKDEKGEEEMDTDMEMSVPNSSEKFREQLLGIKNSLEKLHTDFGLTSNYLLIVEDNVTKSSEEKDEDFSTFGRYG